MQNNKKQEIVISLKNNLKLIAKQNDDPGYENEIHIGILKDNIWHQDLAIIRIANTNDNFEVLVYADENNEDYTNKYTIGLYKDPEDK